MKYLKALFKIKTTLFFLFIFSCNSNLFSSNPDALSFENDKEVIAHLEKIHQTNSLAEKLENYYYIYVRATEISPSKGAFYIKKSKETLGDSKDKESMAWYLLARGGYLGDDYQYQAALDTLTIAKKLFEDLGMVLNSLRALDLKITVQVWANKTDKALQSTMEAIEKHEHQDSLTKYIARFSYILGYIYYDRAQIEQSNKYLNKSIQLYKKINSNDWLLPAEFLVTNFNIKNEPVKATKLGLEILAYAQKIDDKNAIASIAKDLSYIYYNIRDLATSEKYAKMGLKVSKEIDYQYGVVWCYQSLSKVYRMQKRFEKAQEVLEKAVKVTKNYKESDPNFYVSSLYYLGEYYVQTKELELAEENLTEAYKLSKELDLNIERRRSIERSLGEVYVFQKRHKEAAQLLESCLAYYILQKDTIDIGATQERLATIYYQKGQYKKAFDLLREATTDLGASRETEKIKAVADAKSQMEFDNEKELIAVEQEKQEAILKAETKQTRTIAFGIGALALLSLGFFWNSRRNNKKIQAQNELISGKNSELEQLNHTKDRLFAIIGHDLRKPVVAFRGVSKTINYLVQKEDYASLQKLGGAIEKDGFALQKLTDNLLSWALSQRDVLPYRPTTINLSQMVEDIQLIFENPAAKKNIELTHTIPDALNVFADFNALMTILTNLVDNALKYTPEGGRITLIAKEENGFIQFQVSDTGVGIASAQLSDIFLLKKDKSQKGTHGEKGTGLGLHLVNELVKMNKGEIHVESEVGKGTVFRVLLPKENRKAA